MKDCVSSHCHHLFEHPPKPNTRGARPQSSRLLDASSLHSLSLPQEVSRSLIKFLFTEKIWGVALDTGANVLALNILEAAASNDSANAKRNSLNSKIANHQQKR